MTSIEESGLVFRFPSGWAVHKYDEHTFYKGFSGRGLKAVDFIVLPPRGGIWLIEVKNFRPRRAINGQTYYPRIKPVKRLAAQLQGKFRDSLRAIHIIHEYYRRKWWYRLAPAWLRGRDINFWIDIYYRLQNAPPPHLLIWIELDPVRKKYRDRFFGALHKHFASEPVQLEIGFEGRNPLAGMEVIPIDGAA